MRYLPYNKDLKSFSRELRNHSTRSEITLWNQLKRKQVKGLQFNRQKPLGPFIVDFYCKRLNLVIEIDGITHESDEAKLNDAKRQSLLEGMGLKFLRFTDEEVLQNIDGVIRKIEMWVEENTNPPDPL